MSELEGARRSRPAPPAAGAAVALWDLDGAAAEKAAAGLDHAVGVAVDNTDRSSSASTPRSPTRSTRTTPASSIAANGTGSRPASSTTREPVSGPPSAVRNVALEREQLVDGETVGEVDHVGSSCRRGATRVHTRRTCSATMASGMPEIDAQKYTDSTGAPAVWLRTQPAISSGVP